MNTQERSKVMDSIAVEGDTAVFEFGKWCMAILERDHEVTMEDAQEFLEGRS